MAKTFEVIYQTAGAGTGLAPQLDVYKPDKTKDVAQSGVMTEIGTTGRYYKSFDADAPDWSVQVADANGGKAVKIYDKTAYDAAGVAALVADVQTAIDNANSAIATVNSLLGTVDGKIDTVDTNVDGLVTSVSSLATQLGIIEGKVDDLDSPAMIG
jgi:flagellin-like hook-associated protein FlgL